VPDVLDIDRGLGVPQVQRLHVFHDDPGHGEVAKPLVIGRDDKPGRMLGAAS
jgi:hypothetical protein